MDAQLDILVYLLTEKEGGRSTPFSSGYRGQFYYDDANWLAQYHVLEKDRARPGELVTLAVQLGAPANHFQKLYRGQAVEIREGHRIIARGKVIVILDNRFAK